MRIKKFLALLLSAALALTMLAGCGSQSLLQLLLDLLQNQYQNITVTAEDDLEDVLRRAVNENDTIEDVDADLAKALGKTVEFNSLRSARAGDQTFDLLFKTGNDTQAIAQQTYAEWNIVFGSLPSSGRYTAGLAMLKADHGYYVLVDVDVNKGASNSHDDDDDQDDGTLMTEITIRDEDLQDDQLETLKQILRSNPITTVHFEVKSETIPTGLFEANNQVKNVSIGADAKVEENAFEELNHVTFKPTGSGDLNIDKTILGGAQNVTLDLNSFSGSLTFKDNAFKNYTGLTSLDLTDCTGAVTFGASAFAYCNNLTTLKLPTKDVPLTFEKSSLNSTGLTSLDLSGRTDITIESAAFGGCEALQTVNLSGCTGLTTIGPNAFGGCRALETVDLSGCTNLTTIEDSAFGDNVAMTELNLRGCINLTSIEGGAFCASRITTLDLSDCANGGTLTIGPWTFSNTFNLATVYFPTNAEGLVLQRGAFGVNGDQFTSDDFAAISVYIPSNLTSSKVMLQGTSGPFYKRYVKLCCENPIDYSSFATAWKKKSSAATIEQGTYTPPYNG